MRKLIILPTFCNSIGGATVSLHVMIRGFKQCSRSEQLCVLVESGSLMEEYLQHAGQADCMQLIQAQNQRQFFKYALQWVREQPRDWPLLLESCISTKHLAIFISAAPAFRLSGRPIYLFFHDLAHSYNPVANLVRKFTFACLSPGAICNSNFTAEHVCTHWMPEIQGVLYQPVDTEQFNEHPSGNSPPTALQPVLRSGARVMLTPSRISEPEGFNDKNLRSLILVLAQLKAMGHYYYGVVIGRDSSTGQNRTHALLEQAKRLGVADRFLVLPPTFDIEEYYKHADVVVTLAPREPFGRTVVEAIACGVPVVGSQTGGIGEILGHFAPEWTVDSNDPVTAAQTIIRITTDPKTPKTLAEGRHWVEAQCNPVDYVHKIMEITSLTSSSSSKTDENPLVC